MTCEQLVACLMDYLTEALPPAQRQLLDEHLVECRDCAVYLATYREAIGRARAACAEGEPLHPEVLEEVMRSVLAALHREQMTE